MRISWPVYRRGVVLMLLWSGVAAADDRLVPYASAKIEHNSNIFDLSGREEALQQNGDETLADTVLRYAGGVEVRLPWSKQTLRAVAEARRMEFDHFSRLDHDEHLLSAGLDLHFSPAVEGTVDYRDERRMASFANRDDTELTIETERIGSALAKLSVTPDWRLEVGARWRELESPLPDLPEFGIEETTLHTELKYLAEETLSAGLLLEYLDGEFVGVADSGKFDQQTLALTADYFITGFTRIGAELGYSRRDDSGGGSLSALTGMLGYRRELTGKTTADVQLFRRIQSYVGGASTVVESGIRAGLEWKATEKILLAAGYQWTDGKYESASPSFDNQNRRDDDQLASLKLDYRLLHWLSFKPYYAYQTRDSNIASEDFSTTIAGLEVLARFQTPQ
jgi:hypothetical protein